MLTHEMELRHLRYFAAVADEENVSRAALKLHVSQPALSRQIRDLEEELGFALLERSAKSVRLTEAGKTFRNEARAVLERADEAVKAARRVAGGGQGELHVGYAPSLTARILPPVLRAFQAESPYVRVLLHDLHTEDMLQRLHDGTLRFAFMVRPNRARLRELSFAELLRDRLCLAVAPKHPYARKQVVDLTEIARQPLVVYNRAEYPDYHESLARLFASIKSKPIISGEHDGIASLIAEVEAGSAVALVSESVACIAGPRLKLIPLSPPSEPLIIGAAWSKRGLDAIGEQFLKCAKDAALTLGNIILAP